ncbi:MAG: metallophosphoesterase [Treponema sp.]|nr:metallophosphoesterase [Treponema sp.]
MVRKNIFINAIILLLCALCLASGCNNDFLGLIYSSDLDERLRSKDEFNFLTAQELSPSPGFGSSYSFIVLADTHIEGGNAWGLENLTNVISSNLNIKFVVVLGDITQNGAREDIDRFKQIANSLTVPFYPVIGNHDIYFGNWSVYREEIGSTRYRVNGTGTTLFMLDSANSFFGRDQLNWLERELRNTQGRIFVFTHTRLFVTGPVDLQHMTDIRERARIVSMLQNKCDAVFMGHSHKRIINEAGNVQYINVDDFVNSKTYCLVTVPASGKITYEFHRLP